MSIRAVGWVLDESPVQEARNLLILISLADYAGEGGDGAYPSVKTLARRGRMSPRSVQYALRELESQGHIERTGTSPRGTAIYRIIMGPLRGADSAPLYAVAGAEVAPGGVQPVAPEPSVDPSSTTPLPPSPTATGEKVTPIKPRARGTNSRARGTNPRATAAAAALRAPTAGELAAWERVVADVAAAIDADLADMWLAPLYLAAVDDTGALVLAATDTDAGAAVRMLAHRLAERTGRQVRAASRAEQQVLPAVSQAKPGSVPATG